jgi:hypothetical protein
LEPSASKGAEGLLFPNERDVETAKNNVDYVRDRVRALRGSDDRDERPLAPYGGIEIAAGLLGLAATLVLSRVAPDLRKIGERFAKPYVSSAPGAVGVKSPQPPLRTGRSRAGGGLRTRKISSEGSAAAALGLPAADDAGKAQTGSGHPERIHLIVPVQLKRRGSEMKLIVEGGTIAEDLRIDKNLVRLIVRVRILAQRFWDNPAATMEDIAAGEGYGATYAGGLLRLTCLAPDFVMAVLDGRQPPELTANALMTDTRLPLEWSAQRAALGFPAKAVIP